MSQVCVWIYVYLGIELLSFMISICVALEETESSKVFVLFCTLTSNVLIFCCAISLSMFGIAVGFHFSDFRTSLVAQLVKIPPAIQETPFDSWISQICWRRDPLAAAAKSLQSCPTLCDPIDGSPPGSPVPGILQARTLEWVAMSFSTTHSNFLAWRIPWAV